VHIDRLERALPRKTILSAGFHVRCGVNSVLNSQRASPAVLLALPGGGCGSAPSAGPDYAPKLTLAAPQPMPWIQTCWSPGKAASRSDADTIICALNDSSFPSPAR
jgi:hypothetical protein